MGPIIFSLEEHKQVLAYRCWLFSWEACVKEEALISMKWQGDNNIFESVKWWWKECQLIIHSTKLHLPMCQQPLLAKCSCALFWKSYEIIHSEHNLSSCITSYYISCNCSCIKLIIWLSINNNLCLATAHFSEMPDLETSRHEEFITWESSFQWLISFSAN